MLGDAARRGTFRSRACEARAGSTVLLHIGISSYADVRYRIKVLGTSNAPGYLSRNKAERYPEAPEDAQLSQQERTDRPGILSERRRCWSDGVLRHSVHRHRQSSLLYFCGTQCDRAYVFLGASSLRRDRRICPGVRVHRFFEQNIRRVARVLLFVRSCYLSQFDVAHTRSDTKVSSKTGTEDAPGYGSSSHANAAGRRSDMVGGHRFRSRDNNNYDSNNSKGPENA